MNNIDVIKYITDNRREFVSKLCAKYGFSEFDADDCLQDTLTKIFMSKPFDDNFAMSTFYYPIMRSVAIDRLRNMKNEMQHIALEDKHNFIPAPDEDIVTDSDIDIIKRKDALLAAMDHCGLKRRERAVFELFLNGLEYREISEATEIPYKMIKVYFFRAKKKILDYLNAPVEEKVPVPSVSPVTPTIDPPKKQKKEPRHAWKIIEFNDDHIILLSA